MKRLIILPMLCMLLVCINCNENKKEKDTDQAMDTQDTEMMMEDEMEMAVNADSLATEINKRRGMIEENLGEPFEMSTDNLRAKTKQKWSKIHFYTKDGQVVRVKTYPYEGVSKRTEEFYFDNSSLMLAVVEDDGSQEVENEGDVDKMYYYYNGEPIKEMNNSKGEKEYTLKESDAEELHQEAMEYLDLYKNREQE